VRVARNIRRSTVRWVSLMVRIVETGNPVGFSSLIVPLPVSAWVKCRPIQASSADGVVASQVRACRPRLTVGTRCPEQAACFT
jgi:hypothetical protein